MVKRVKAFQNEITGELCKTEWEASRGEAWCKSMDLLADVAIDEPDRVLNRICDNASNREIIRTLLDTADQLEALRRAG